MPLRQKQEVQTRMASADLPRRQSRDDSIKRRQAQSAREILMQMGFPKQRVEKAIAATGDRGVQLASDWLLSHVNDQTLDIHIPREYILYLCPVGPLMTQLSDFWDKSMATCGWNGAHSYFPHITLCPFFKCDDNKVDVLSRAMALMEEKLSECPGKLKLDFFSQMNFIGLFVGGEFYDFLIKVTDDFSAQIRKSGIHLEPHRKQLHMTLAYQYPAEQQEKLLKLAKEIDLSADVRWDFRLYSRDAMLSQAEIRKVIKKYSTQLGDELELIEGDFIAIDPKEVEKSKDGWYSGTSWLTGNSGMFPGTYTKKTQETFAWTHHRSIPLEEGPEPPPHVNGHYDDIIHDENNYALVTKNKPQDSPKFKRAVAVHRPKMSLKTGPRKLFVTRHGERPDFSIGRSWFEEAFNDDGVYTRTNMALPEKMYKRKTFLEYNYDPPLTEIGKCQARLTGEYLLKTEANITQIYSSPSLRCIQTAVEIYKAFGLTNKIKIEPGLFEWTYHVGVPKFMDPQELTDEGLPILTNYCPQYLREDLDPDETVDDLYDRCNKTTHEILKSHEKTGDNILIAGHSGTLDLCTRSLLGKAPKSKQQYQDFICKIPFCCTFVLEQNKDSKKWSPSYTHYLPLGTGKCVGFKTETFKSVME